MTKYIREATLSDGSVYYRYNPPSRYVEEGIVKRCNLGINKAYAFRKGSDFNTLINFYEKQRK